MKRRTRARENVSAICPQIGVDMGRYSAMKLSEGERLILYMLCDLYKALGVKGEIDPELVGNAVVNGDLWLIEDEYHGLFPTQETSRSVVNEVIDILDMWRFIERSVAQFNKSELDQLTSRPKLRPSPPEFVGFDGNNESDHFHVARTIVEKRKLFTEFADRELNSHHPILDEYHRMYAVFSTIRPLLADREMTLDELVSVLEAGAGRA